MTEINGIITIKEVMDELGLSSKQTIYNYISEGKLTPINKDDWHIERRYEFNREDVLRLKEELTPPGLTTSEVAVRLDVSQTTINKFIRTGQLVAIKQEYKGKQYNFITEEALEEFQQHHEIGTRPTKKNFYDKARNIVLFQPFVKEENGTKRIARITSLEDEQIVIQTEDGELLSYEKLLEQGYAPMYSITEQKQITKDGYATFRFKVPTYMKSNHFYLIDSFYTSITPVNMRVEKSENEEDVYLVHVKPSLISGPYTELLELFQSSLISGFIKKRRNGIYIDSDIETIRLRLTSKQKNELERKVKSLQMSVEEFILFAVNEIK